MNTEPARLKQPLLLVAAWIATRLVVLAQLAPFGFMIGDVRYYWRKLEELSQMGISATMTEYPSPVV